MRVREGKAEIETGGLFYNPHMRFNRSFSSLGVGAIGKGLGVVDGFCATGIRGVRYAVENSNVLHVTFIDKAWRAKEIIEQNARLLPSFDVRIGDFNREILNLKANFVEIDPFGTPVPFVFPAGYMLSPLKTSYLSITATDVAVLCGSEVKACWKKYGAKSLNVHFTHEVGARILLKKIADLLCPLDLAFKVLFTLSKRHYIKVMLKVERSAKNAQHLAQMQGFAVFCPHCAFQSFSSDLPKSWSSTPCPNCGKPAMVGGPMFAGEIQDQDFLSKMAGLNEERDYEDKREIRLVLERMRLDNLPLYYHLHTLAKYYRKRSPKMESVLEGLRALGFKAARTHFSDFAFKTDAPFEEVVRVFKSV